MKKPKDVGISLKRLKRIGPAVKKTVTDDKIAGAVTLVARADEIVYFESFGLLDKEKNRPMNKDALFRIYSMTKPITCVALMTLYEKGLFQLNDPVALYIPEFEKVQVYDSTEENDGLLLDLDRPVTIRDLLTHTSGLTYHFLEYGEVEKLYRQKGIASEKPLKDFVDDLLQLPLAFQPGSSFRYSFAHDAAARLVEIISGDTFGDYLQKYIFDPLDMYDTGFYVSKENLPRLTSMYGTMDIVGPDATATKLWKGPENAGSKLIANSESGIETHKHTIHRGGHGLVSSTLDYYNFCRMLLNGGRFKGKQLLSPKTVQLMTTNHLSPELLPYEIREEYSPGYGYGLGFRVLMDLGQAGTLGSIGEYGWGGAANTYFWIDPKEKMIGILMAQFQPGGYYSLSQDFRVAGYQSIRVAV